MGQQPRHHVEQPREPGRGRLGRLAAGRRHSSSSGGELAGSRDPAQPSDHGLGEVGRRDRHDLRAVARHLVGQPVDVAEVHLDRRPPVAGDAVRDPFAPARVGRDPGAAPQRVATPVADPQRRHPRRRRRDLGGVDHHPGVVVLGDVVGAGRTAGGDGGVDPSHPEHPSGAPVEVVAGEVPAPVPLGQPPRLEVPRTALRVGLAVPEGHRAPVTHRPAERLERLLRGADHRLDADERGVVHGDAGGAQLAQGARCRAGQAGPRPGARGEGQGRHLVRLERDLRQRILALVDPVAELVVEDGVDHGGHERDAELAQLVLVALEHPVEGLVGGGAVVLRDGRTDPGLRQRHPGREQRDDEVEQALGLDLRRGVHGRLPAHSAEPTRATRPE